MKSGSLSPSSRRAWIEIMTCSERHQHGRIALLAEGVDRNHLQGRRLRDPEIALLAEGVDRNRACNFVLTDIKRSPSSRRAWIEICACRTPWTTARIALLAEGVDRNATENDAKWEGYRSPSSRRAWIEIIPHWGERMRCCPSPSSRRAWIEIKCSGGGAAGTHIALLAEGVDRNLDARGRHRKEIDRPPRGGRG